MGVRDSGGQRGIKVTIRQRNIIWGAVFVFLPLLIGLVASLPLYPIEVLVFFAASTTAIGLYRLFHQQDVPENLSTGVALGMSLIVVFVVLAVAGYSIDENVLGNYVPHFGNIAAWAFPTLMGFQAKRYLDRKNHIDELSEKTVDTVQFGVALLYAVVYSLMDVNLSEPVEYIFIVLLILWLLSLFVELLTGEE